MIKIDRVDVDRHPCASKQVRIVIFARREHGWGGAGDAAKEQQLVKSSKFEIKTVVLLKTVDTYDALQEGIKTLKGREELISACDTGYHRY